MGPQVKGSLIGDVTNHTDLTPLPGTDIKDTLEFLKPESPYYGIASLRSIRNMIDLHMYHTTGDCYYIIKPTMLTQQLLSLPSTSIDLNDVCYIPTQWGELTEVQNIGDHYLVDYAYQSLDIC
jgi:hypothetical protein